MKLLIFIPNNNYDTLIFYSPRILFYFFAFFFLSFFLQVLKLMKIKEILRHLNQCPNIYSDNIMKKKLKINGDESFFFCDF